MIDTVSVVQHGIDNTLDCVQSLIESCEKVGGSVPSLDMTLREFISIYGRNGILFSSIYFSQKEV